MGKQYNKLIKRRRRTAYLARLKKASKSSITDKPAKSKKVVSAPKKTSAKNKPVPVKENQTVAEKAKAEDVLGVEQVSEKTEHKEAGKDQTVDS